MTPEPDSPGPAGRPEAPGPAGRRDARAEPVDWRRYTADPEVVDGLSCIIFTSGSTGEPKGVELTHAAVANRLAGMLAAHRLGPDDVLLQQTPYTFDVSIWELLRRTRTATRRPWWS
jgi:non-ribosomal peptide synthetase component F